MGVVDVYVRVFRVCPVSELTWIAICDYGEVVLPHGLDNCVRMVILQKPWVKSVPEMSTPLSPPSVLPTVKPAPSKNCVILLYNNLSRDVLAKRVGNVLRSCPIGAS